MKILFTSALFLATIAAFGQEKTAEQFKHLDKNGDEKLTVEEAPERARLIRAADADKSGDATLAEIAAILKLGLRRTQPDPNTPPSTTVAEKFPEDALFTKTSCQRAAQYSDEANGHAVVVMHRGKILFEHYANRWSAEKPHRLASGTKSFSGALLAAAVKDGLLTLDEPVSKTITEWKKDEKLAVITIQDLLSLTSGIHPGTVGKVPAYAESIVQKRQKKLPEKNSPMVLRRFRFSGKSCAESSMVRIHSPILKTKSSIPLAWKSVFGIEAPIPIPSFRPVRTLKRPNGSNLENF